MSRIRLDLSDEDAKRVRDILGAVRRNWNDRLWDWVPRLVVAALIWLCLLTVLVSWLFWRELARQA